MRQYCETSGAKSRGAAKIQLRDLPSIIPHFKRSCIALAYFQFFGATVAMQPLGATVMRCNRSAALRFCWKFTPQTLSNSHLPHFGHSSRFPVYSMKPSQILNDAQSLRDWGESLGARLRAGDIVTLDGPLGAGKTTLTQGLARALGIAQDVTSPTFVLINEYASAPPLLHLDAYRLENLAWDELRDAGLEDFLSRTDAVRVVEWPSMIAPYLPAADWKITIHIEGDGRRIEVEQG